MSGRPRDLVGQTFGRLVVLELAKRSAEGLVRWRCVCSCGEIATVKARNLVAGNTRSCGCLRVEAARANLIAFRKVPAT